VQAPNPSDDGVEDVKLDPETGWPEAIAEAAAAAPSDSPDDTGDDTGDSRAAPKLSARELPKLSPGSDEVMVDLFDDGADRVSSRNEPRRMRKRRRKAKARRIIPAENEVRQEIANNFFQDGKPTLDTSGVRQKQRLLRELAKDAEKKEATNGVESRLAFAAESEQRYSTFAVDVDTGSYALSLGRMRRGYPPRPETVRVEEWLNSFHYDHDVPEGQTFSVQMEAGPHPMYDGDHMLRVNIAGKSVADDERPTAHLTFVVDVSGSMFGPDKIDLIKEALTYLTRRLRPDDTIAIVTYAKETGVILWPTPASRKDKIIAAIADLEPGGSTAIDDGLKMGYTLAFRKSHFTPGDIHRVVLLGDGRVNVGARTAKGLLGPISAAVDKGVTLSTIGFGAREFNDALMEQLANQGNGNYTFIDSFKDVRRVFGEQLCGTLHVIGKDAKIQVDFNTDRVKSWELVGYENRKLATKDFRDDKVDAGEIGAGHQVTALYRLKLKEGTSGRIATARFRWQEPKGEKVSELEVELDELKLATSVSPDFKFAAAVAGAAQHFGITGEFEEAGFDFKRVSRNAEEGIGDNPKQKPARLEFIELANKLEPLMK
jgi:Ca-activated chloride channel family protein